MSFQDRERFQTVGEWLASERERRGLSRQEAARKVQAQPAYVQGLETNDYRVFPAKVYALGFLRKILRLYRVQPPDESAVIEAFQQEWQVASSRAFSDRPPPGESRPGPYAVTARTLLLGLIASLMLVFTLFAGVRIRAFLSAPTLAVAAPLEGAILSTPVVLVRGRTEKESRLTVNGRELRIDPDGNFDTAIEVPAGRTTLEFVAENRFGKVTIHTRNVYLP